MSVNNYLTFVLIAVAVFTAYMAVVNVLRKDKNKLRARKIEEETLPELDEKYDTLTPLALLLKQILFITGVNIEKQNETAMQLSRAGYNSKTSLVYFIAFRRLVQPVLFAIGGIILAKLFIFENAEVKKHLAALLSGLLLCIVGIYGSKLFIQNSTQKRSKEIIKTFPDALDLILICVESGLGIDAAFSRVCKEMKESHPTIASEFERTRFEMNMMSDRVQALQNFGDRTGLGPIRTLVSSLIQAEKFGTSLVDTMRTISEEQRMERMMNAEERAARLPAMITLPLIIFILPALFLIILGPAGIKLKEQGGLFGDQK